MGVVYLVLAGVALVLLHVDAVFLRVPAELTPVVSDTPAGKTPFSLVHHVFVFKSCGDFTEGSFTFFDCNLVHFPSRALPYFAELLLPGFCPEFLVDDKRFFRQLFAGEVRMNGCGCSLSVADGVYYHGGTVIGCVAAREKAFDARSHCLSIDFEGRPFGNAGAVLDVAEHLVEKRSLPNGGNGDIAGKLELASFLWYGTTSAGGIRLSELHADTFKGL